MNLYICCNELSFWKGLPQQIKNKDEQLSFFKYSIIEDGKI